MKVFLFLIMIWADDPTPQIGQVEVADGKACIEQLRKQLDQPAPRGLTVMQAGCRFVFPGDPA